MQLFCFLFFVLFLGSGLAKEDKSYSKIVTKPNGETEGDIFVDLPAQSYYKIKFTVRAPKHLEPEPSYRRINNVEHKSRQLPTPSETIENAPQTVENAPKIAENDNAFNDAIVKERKIVERSTVAPPQDKGEESKRPISYRYRILPSKLKTEGHSGNGIHAYPRSKPLKPYYPTRYSPYPSPSYSPTISYQTTASQQQPTRPYPTSTQPTVEETTYTQETYEATTVEPTEVAVDEVIEITEYDQEVAEPSNQGTHPYLMIITFFSSIIKIKIPHAHTCTVKNRFKFILQKEISNNWQPFFSFLSQIIFAPPVLIETLQKSQDCHKISFFFRF